MSISKRLEPIVIYKFSKYMAARTSSVCPFGADNQFGPRTDISCRPFDFTLLFEDICFGCLPPSVFLLAVLTWLYSLWNRSVKVDSYKLAISKLVCTSIRSLPSLKLTSRSP